MANEHEQTHVVDMRSDVLTLPTAGMKEAMINAQLGNDEYREDPTVIALEEKCAAMFGKEKALYVPTGTMGNLLCIMSHCERNGCEIMAGDQSHIFLDEQGAASQFAGAQTRTVKDLCDGTFDINEMVSKIRDSTDYHFPETKVVCVENTHNRYGGKALPISFLKKLYDTSKSKQIAVHMDGARLWNAAMALDFNPGVITQYCDTVCVGFAKALACTDGAVIAGPGKFIERCRRSKKALGGQMRQTGVLAAAALHAIDNVFPLVEEDHRRAQMFLQGILDAEHKALSINQEGILTNIIRINIDAKYDVKKICDRMRTVTLEERQMIGDNVKVLVNPIDHHALRFVTYFGQTDNDIKMAIRKCNYVLSETFNIQ